MADQGQGQGPPGQQQPGPIDPAAQQAMQAAVVAAAMAVAQQQQQAAAQPPPNLNQFPLVAGDVVGDSFLTMGFTSNHGQYALHQTEGLNSLEAILELDLDAIDTLSSNLSRRTQAQGGYRMTAAQQLNPKARMVPSGNTRPPKNPSRSFNFLL